MVIFVCLVLGLCVFCLFCCGVVRIFGIIWAAGQCFFGVLLPICVFFACYVSLAVFKFLLVLLNGALMPFSSAPCSPCASVFCELFCVFVLVVFVSIL